MKNKLKTSHQGIREIEAIPANQLKLNFIQEFVETEQLKTTGYFIGKALLYRILMDNEDAEGFVFSFGLNASLSGSSAVELSLIIEPALSDEEDGIIEDREKYSTGLPGEPGPDNILPAIKPTPRVR